MLGALVGVAPSVGDAPVVVPACSEPGSWKRWLSTTEAAEVIVVGLSGARLI
jgi:hypothetical protein